MFGITQLRSRALFVFTNKLEKMKFVIAFFLSALSFSEVLAEGGWPDGQYCLPMPANQRCPIDWVKGYRYHDTQDFAAHNGYFNKRNGHVPHLSVFGRNLGWGFCCKVKTSYPIVQTSWPKGNYCIFRKGGVCPDGFDAGSIFWDDEDDNNQNSVNGTIPDGYYGRNTKVRFCCREDGTEPLTDLPSGETFMLMRRKGSCPSVAGYRRAYSGYLYWDTEHTRNVDEKLGVYPDGESKCGRGVTIEFCTYKTNHVMNRRL